MSAVERLARLTHRSAWYAARKKPTRNTLADSLWDVFLDLQNLNRKIRQPEYIL